MPLEGFASLQGVNGVKRFTISHNGAPPTSLPQAHTWCVAWHRALFPLPPCRRRAQPHRCRVRPPRSFNLLDLPAYRSEKELEERLSLAIAEGSEGYGLV